MSENTVGYFLVKKIHVQGANCVSSPITYGFPSVTGFMGAIHALNRKILNIEEFEDTYLSGVGIACLECKPHIFRPHPYADYTFNQTRNPLKKKNGQYQTPPIIEEGKTDLVVSLIIEVTLSSDDSEKYFEFTKEDNVKKSCKIIKNKLLQQRLCGGSVMNIESVSFFEISSADKIKNQLLPSSILLEAREDLNEITAELREKNPETSSLDALIETCKVHFIPHYENSEYSEQDPNKDESEKLDSNKITWKAKNIKTGRGWLVPISVGYQAISEKIKPGNLQNSRHPGYPSQYVESIYTLGKWVFPLRSFEISECIWRYDNQDVNQNLYIVKQMNQGE